MLPPSHEVTDAIKQVKKILELAQVSSCPPKAQNALMSESCYLKDELEVIKSGACVC